MPESRRPRKVVGGKVSRSTVRSGTWSDRSCVETQHPLSVLLAPIRAAISARARERGLHRHGWKYQSVPRALRTFPLDCRRDGADARCKSHQRANPVID